MYIHSLFDTLNVKTCFSIKMFFRPSAPYPCFSPPYMMPPMGPPPLTLIYWPLRGVAAPIRMLLAFVGAPFVEKNPTGEEWFGDNGLKSSIKRTNALANLPTLQDGPIFISQSEAVIRYLGDRFHLGGDPLRANQLFAELSDLRSRPYLWFMCVSVYVCSTACLRACCRTDGSK